MLSWQVGVAKAAGLHGAGPLRLPGQDQAVGTRLGAATVAAVAVVQNDLAAAVGRGPPDLVAAVAHIHRLDPLESVSGQPA